MDSQANEDNSPSHSVDGRKTVKKRRFLRWVGKCFKVLAAGMLILSLVGFTYETIASRVDRKEYPPPGQLVDVGGYRMHIQCAGQGSPTAVLDTGLGSTALYWGKIAPEVARFTRVCTYDRAGYGWSDTGPEPRSSEQITRELHTLLTNAGVPRPYVIVGWSFGGFTARIYPQLYPGEVAGVVLVDSTHEEQFVRYVPTVVNGIKKTGLNLDPVVKFLGGPERFHTFVELAAVRWDLIRSRLGLLRWSRRNEQESDFWEKYPPDTWKRERFCELQHGFLTAVRGEKAAWEESTSQAHALSTLGDLPLIVVSRAPEMKGPYPEWFPAVELERDWQTMQSELVRLSTRGRQVFAHGSDHLIPHHSPQVVTDSIFELVGAYRKGPEVAQIR
jgi:pimeloyl-ACP methyl ester carboxylesterase